MEWSHTALGRFDIAEQWVGLDFSKLFLDPVRADTTLFHDQEDCPLKMIFYARYIC
jgi:hypothetical protein